MKLSGFFILCVSLYSLRFGSTAWAQNSASGDHTAVEHLSQKASGDISVNVPNKSSSDVTTAVISVLESVPDNKPEKKTNIKKELFYKCVRGKEMRWMRLNYLKNGKCKTTYSREGDAKDVSQAEVYETCESVLNNIKKNLESGGYICEEKILMGTLNLE